MGIVLTSDKHSNLYNIFGRSAGSAVIECALALDKDPYFESNSRAQDITSAKEDYNKSETGSPEEDAALLKIIEFSTMTGVEQFFTGFDFNWQRPVGMLIIRKVAAKILHHW